MGLLSTIADKAGIIGNRGKVVLLVNGVDDVITGTPKPLQDIEPGSYLNGYIEITTDTKNVPEDTTVLVEFVLKGKYFEHSHTKAWDVNQEGELRTVQNISNTKKWLETSTRVVVAPLVVRNHIPTAQNPTATLRRQVLRYPFSYKIQEGLPPSLHVARHGGQYNFYTLTAKVQYLNSGLKLKPVTRGIHLAGARPTVSGELPVTRLPPVQLAPMQHQNKKAEPQGALLSKSNVIDADVRCDAFCYVEGQTIFVTANIHNSSSKMLQMVNVSLNEVCHYPLVRHHYAFGREIVKLYSSVALVDNQYHALEIMPGAQRHLKFAIRVPDYVETSTCGWSHEGAVTEFHHSVKVKIWSMGLLTNDCKVRAPVNVSPNPARYAYSPPVPLDRSYFLHAPQHAVNAAAPAAENVPPPYERMNFCPPTPKPREYMQPSLFRMQLVSGANLPRMNFGMLGMGGKAHPFVTIWINDTHVRQSKVIENNLDPRWGESFFFPLDPKETLQPLRMKLVCYDEDTLTTDGKIGDSEFTVDIPTQPEEFTVTLRLVNKKKGTVLERGTLTFVLYPMGV